MILVKKSPRNFPKLSVTQTSNDDISLQERKNHSSPPRPFKFEISGITPISLSYPPIYKIWLPLNLHVLLNVYWLVT